MKRIFIISKKAVTPHYIPLMDQPILERVVISETKTGYRVKAEHAAHEANGVLFQRKAYDFFDTRADALKHLADVCNRVAAELEERKRAAVALMCDAHDRLRQEPQQ